MWVGRDEERDWKRGKERERIRIYKKKTLWKTLGKEIKTKDKKN